MGFSPMFKGILHSHVPDGPLQFFVENMGYSIGFLVVILARQQLFTENTLTAVLPVMSEPDIAKLLRLIRLWSVVLCGNLIGVSIFAFGLLHLKIFNDSIDNAFVGMGQELMANSPMEMFTKAIFAGWLIATMVWLLPSAPDVKFWTILLFTYLIGIGGFTHIIVGAEEGAYLVLSGKLSVVDYATKLLAPVLLGNIVGGTLIFALINHAQVRSET
jgi:formate/nitrite transporter FocA (FNT family)